ncbi:Uncharacterised protein g6372 [Pycnogonum litorale]
MAVCSRHFVSADFMWNNTDIGVKRKRLKKDVIPSQNLPVRTTEKFENEEKKKSDLQRKERLAKRTMCNNNNFCGNSAGLEKDEKSEKMEVAQMLLELSSVLTPDVIEHLGSSDERSRCQPSTKDKGIQANTYEEKPAVISDMIRTDDQLTAFTGLSSFVCFNRLLEAVNTFADRNLSRNAVLLLMKLKLNLTYRCISVLFNMSITTVRRTFYQTVSVLSYILEAAIPWPDKSVITRNLPKYFLKYPRTRIVLDCTEFEVCQPKCLKCRIKTYSHYKGRHTLKLLVGCSPSGLITFVSNCFGGRSSDKAITAKSGVIEKLERYVDDVMVDKGFFIDQLCAEHNIGLIRPAFLRQANQFSKSAAVSTYDIARARVHVERAIQRIKVFKILSTKIDWHLVSYIDDIIKIICGIVNISNPILSDERF